MSLNQSTLYNHQEMAYKMSVKSKLGVSVSLSNVSVYINPIRLPSLSQVNTDFVGATVRCSGWGRISDRKYNDTHIYITIQ
jgi:hypothetical protein